MTLKLGMAGALSAGSAIIAVLVLGTTLVMMENDSMKQFNYADLATISTQRAWINAYAVSGKAVSDALTDQAYTEMVITPGRDCNALAQTKTSAAWANYKNKVTQYVSSAVNPMGCQVRDAVMGVEALKPLSDAQMNASSSSLVETSQTGSADVNFSFKLSCSDVRGASATYEREVAFRKRISFYRIVTKNVPPTSSAEYYYKVNDPSAPLAELYSAAYKAKYGLGSSYYSAADINARASSSVGTKCYIGALDIPSNAVEIPPANSSADERNAIACRYESDPYKTGADGNVLYSESDTTAQWSGNRYYGTATCTDAPTNLNCDYTKLITPTLGGTAYPKATVSCLYKVNKTLLFPTSYSSYQLPFTGITCYYRAPCDNLQAKILNGPFSVTSNTNFTMEGNATMGVPPYSYSWEFPNGNPLDCTFVSPSTSTSKSPMAKCLNGGTATVKLSVADQEKSVPVSAATTITNYSCSISPADQSMSLYTSSSYATRNTQQFSVAGSASPSTWASSNTGVATINSSGLATAVGVGSTTITATSNAGCNPTGPYSTALTIYPAPDTPTGLSATAGNDQVSLNWNLSSGADFYRIRYRIGAGSYTTIDNITTRPYNHTSLTNGWTYYYGIAACNNTGCSSYSTPDVSATPTVPVTVTGVSIRDGAAYAPGALNCSSTMTGTEVNDATITMSTSQTKQFCAYLTYSDGSSQNLNYDTSRNYTFTNYDGTLRWSSNNSDAGSLGTTPSYYGRFVSISTTPTTDKVTAVTYTYKPTAYQTYSAAFSVKVLGSGSPATPTGLAAVAGNGQVSLGWNASTGAATYDLHYTWQGGGNQADVTGITATTQTVTGLSNTMEYTFSVRACNAAGCSEYSSTVKATPAAPPATPATPTGLNATPSSTQVSLGWNSSTGATRYKLDVSGGYTAVIDPIASTSYTDTGLANGITYTYKVAACNASGCSNWSSSVNATPNCTVDPTSATIEIRESKTFTVYGGTGWAGWSLSSGAVLDNWTPDTLTVHFISTGSKTVTMYTRSGCSGSISVPVTVTYPR